LTALCKLLNGSIRRDPDALRLLSEELALRNEKDGRSVGATTFAFKIAIILWTPKDQSRGEFRSRRRYYEYDRLMLFSDRPKDGVFLICRLDREGTHLAFITDSHGVLAS
jgi:hypothetical protein